MTHTTLPSYTPLGTLEADDMIMASISTPDGRINRSITLSGCRSVAEVLTRIRRSLTSVLGLVNINLRNTSRGWTLRRSMLLTTPLPEGTQLSLAI